MKKKIILICMAGLIASTALIGGTLASFSTNTNQDGVANITTKSLGIGLAEEVIYDNGEDGGSLKPGSTISFQRNIVNTQEYDLYTRVTIYKRWKSEVAQETSLDSSMIHLYLDGQEILPENTASIEAQNWILGYADDEQVVLYYKKPLVSGEATSVVLSQVAIDAAINNAYTNVEIMIEFEVDAVQSIAVESAMPAEWGVYPEIDGDGTLISISE